MCKADSKTIKSVMLSLLSLLTFVMLQIVSIHLVAAPTEGESDCKEYLKAYDPENNISLKEDLVQPYKRFLTAEWISKVIQAAYEPSPRPLLLNRRIIYFKARSALLRQYVNYPMLAHQGQTPAADLVYTEDMAKVELDKFAKMYQTYDQREEAGIYPGWDSFPGVFNIGGNSVDGERGDIRYNIAVHGVIYNTLEVERLALIHSLTHAMKYRNPHNNPGDFSNYHLLTRTIQSLIDEIRDEMQFIRSRIQIEELRSHVLKLKK